MKVGVLVEVEEGLDWEHWRSTYTTAERLGFESIWLSDHLDSPWSNPRHGLETWTALAVAAAETERLVLGPLVSPITFREPAIVARMSETMDTLSSGRFVIGLGLGWNADEHAAAGIPFPSVANRTKRLIHTIERIECELATRQIPILIGGKGARSTLPVVARYADEWNFTTSSPAEFQTVSAQLDGLCQQIGRNPRKIRRSAAMGLLIGRDSMDLSKRMERISQLVPPLSGLESARDMGWLVGSPDDIRVQVQALAEVGVERVIFGHYDLEDTDNLAILAETLL